MMARLFSAVFLLPILAASCSVADVDAGQSCCVPSFRQVSDTRIRAVIGNWRVEFSVALVGCAEDLKEITDEERHLLVKEFKDPAQWDNLRLLMKDGRNEDFRAKAVARTNDLLGRDLVADILFHSISGYDHHQMRPDSERDSAEES